MVQTRQIQTAVFPVAGRGARFMPATTAVPKELFPILDTPLLDHAVTEAIDAGATDIVFVTSRDKPAIEKHFENDTRAKFHIVYQDKPRGLGHAVLCARDHVQGAHFSVTLPDDFIVCPQDNVLQQMLSVNADAVIAAMDVADHDVSKYGIIQGSNCDQGLQVESLVEKPSLESAPSNTAIIGRYILPVGVFDILNDISQAHDGTGEIQLTTALDALADQGTMIGYRFDGDRFDCGQVHGWLAANMRMGLERDDTKGPLSEFLKTL